MLPDYRDYRRSPVLMHSAKGSTWKKHKYIKIMNGLYFYPDDYIGGRHLNSDKKSSKKSNKKEDKKNDKSSKSKNGSSKDGKDEKTKLSDKKIEKLANDVIYGKYGVGQERMNKLGKKYDAVQYRVNQKLLGKERAKAIYERSKAVKSSTSSSSKSTSSTKKKKTSSTAKRKR